MCELFCVSEAGCLLLMNNLFPLPDKKAQRDELMSLIHSITKLHTEEVHTRSRVGSEKTL